jgi:serine/threonine-protein kinase
VGVVARICAEVAEGLDALWQAGMVHRDVKPANILLDRDETAYITDFGLAKDSEGTVLTRPGQPLGSMDYMPPEQIRGDPVTGAADTYSLGCVVFECLAGRPPFADREGMRVLWAHLQDAPPDLRALLPDLPGGVADVVARALAKQPEERPASSLAFATELAAAAGAGS